MGEETIGVFNAEDVYGRTRVLFFTKRRIIVVSLERIFWISLLVMIGVIFGVVVLFVRSILTFFVGLGVAIGVGLSSRMIHRLVQHIMVWRVRRLITNGMLKVDEENHEIPYSSIVRVENRAINRYIGGRNVWLMVTLPPEASCGIVTDIVTASETYSFLVSHKELVGCVDLIRRILPDKVA